jgi:hypothetical protein
MRGCVLFNIHRSAVCCVVEVFFPITGSGYKAQGRRQEVGASRPLLLRYWNTISLSYESHQFTCRFLLFSKLSTQVSQIVHDDLHLFMFLLVTNPTSPVQVTIPGSQKLQSI